MKKKKNVYDTYDFNSKEIKKNKNMNDDYKKVIAFVIVLVIVVGITIVLYIINGKYVTKDLVKDTTTQAITYDESKLSVADIFKVKNDDYYVLLYNSKDNLSRIYEQLSSSYSNTEIPLYTVDMNLAMNNKYYDSKGKENKEPKSYKEINITRPTLIKISNGKVTSYITSRDKIINELSKKESK